MRNLNNFKRSLEFVLKHEGGYSNTPGDSGGETKWGISKRAHPDLDIRNLTPELAAGVYSRDYWDASGCDDIPFPFCAAVFDSAVNCGVGRATSWYRDCKDVEVYLRKRTDFYVGLVKKNPSQQKFLRGWLNRVGDLRKFCETSAPSD